LREELRGMLQVAVQKGGCDCGLSGRWRCCAVSCVALQLRGGYCPSNNWRQLLWLSCC